MIQLVNRGTGSHTLAVLEPERLSDFPPEYLINFLFQRG